MSDMRTMNWFSNMDTCDKLLDNYGIAYTSIENAYQANKSLDETVRYYISTLSPYDAKKEGRKIKLRPDWDSVKDEVMFYFLRQKWADQSFWKNTLMNTHPHELIEWNVWHDNYWGHCVCSNCSNKEHLNTLGKMLMFIRQRLVKNLPVPYIWSPTFLDELSF